jgi:hypothetical protein
MGAKEYFGDVVVYETDTIESKVIGLFTHSKMNHCALRISECEAESSDLGTWIHQRNFLRHNLEEPEKFVKNYKILRHEDITPEKRDSMKNFYQKVGKEYDIWRIVRLARRHIRKIEQDMTDLTTNPNSLGYYFAKMIMYRFGNGKRKNDESIDEILKRHDCSAMIRLVHDFGGLDYDRFNKIHPTQFEPYQFLNVPKLKIVDEWKRQIVPKKK